MKDFYELFPYAITAAAGILFLIFKFGKVRRILAFDAAIDVAATVVLCIALSGTGDGIMIALVAGTLISITLWILKQILGTENLTKKGWQEDKSAKEDPFFKLGRTIHNIRKHHQ